jgi:cytidine deaminase
LHSVIRFIFQPGPLPNNRLHPSLRNEGLQYSKVLDAGRMMRALSRQSREAIARCSTDKIRKAISQVLMTFDELYQQAKAVLRPRRLSEVAEAGGVGAALLTDSESVYTGVCIDTASSMGFCAEHAAAAAMVTAGENRVLRMVAVNWDGKVLPPCGRCREFISQLHPENASTEVLVSFEKVVTLGELLPYDWRAAMAFDEKQ